MPRNYGKDYWINHISSWKSSGLTQAAYCKKKGLSIGYFSQLVSKNKNNVVVKSELIEIKPISGNRNILLQVSDSYRMIIPDEFSAKTLEQILDILENRS